MKIFVFSAKNYDRKFLTAALEASPTSIQLTFHDFALNMDSVSMADGADAVCVFVNDNLNAEVVEKIHKLGVKAILLRCAGFNNVCLSKAEELRMFVANVPSYSPEAVAEFALALLQTVNRRTHRAYNRVREGNFSLEGLLGRTISGKTIGLIGTGRIGISFAKLMSGFGCKILAYDPYESNAFKQYGTYHTLEDLLPQCDFISLHCPLTDATHHIINKETLKLMKPGAMLINTSRGGLIDTKDVITALKEKSLAGLGLDVYEEEGAFFYNDHSGDIIQDDTLMRLMTFPNVVVCGHQAFFTEEALTEIALATIGNALDFIKRRPCKNSLVREGHLLIKRGSFPIRI